MMKIGGKLIPGFNVATAIYSSQKSFGEANEALNEGDTLGASLKYMNGITGLMGAIPGPVGSAIGIGGDVVFGGLDTLNTFIEEQNKTGQNK